MEFKTWNESKDTLSEDLITPENDQQDFVPIVNVPEWKINADISEEKKRRALEDLKDGMTVRRVARHLGILADKITRQ